MIPDKSRYLKQEVEELSEVWPQNHSMNIVCHGHSIPCGYTANNVVRMFDAYPLLSHEMLCKRFPMAVINVIISSIGGEASNNGEKRFVEDVLCHKPKIITIDYGVNDRFLPFSQVEISWRRMIETALRENIKLILLTPASDCGLIYYDPQQKYNSEEELSNMIRNLAGEYEIGLADVADAFSRRIAAGELICDFLISVNHLNRTGHEVVAKEVLQWFPYHY